MKHVTLVLAATGLLGSTLALAQKPNQNNQNLGNSSSNEKPFVQPMGEQPVLTDSSMNKPRIDAGAELGVLVPIGEASDGYNTGFGLNLHVSGSVTPNISLGASTGYARHSFKKSLSLSETMNFSGHTSIVPIVGVFKYAVKSLAEGLYFGSDLGLYLWSTKLSVESGSGSMSTTSSKTFLGLAPFVGYKLPISENLAANIAGKFLVIDTDGTDSYKSFQVLAGISMAL